MIAGSGILGALGIRGIDDIDLLVIPELFDDLRTHGWEYHEIEIEGRMRKVVSQGLCEAYKDFWYSGITRNVPDMIRKATMLLTPFLSLQDLKEIKAKLGREKDLRDIKLIEAFEYARTTAHDKMTNLGFPFVYEWTDMPGTAHAEHAHQDCVALEILAREIHFDVGGKSVILTAGSFYDVPVAKMIPFTIVNTLRTMSCGKPLMHERGLCVIHARAMFWRNT